MSAGTMETPASAMAKRCPPIPFSQVSRGALFASNGNIWRKRSTRTAVMHWPAGPEHSFYFGQREMVNAENAPSIFGEQS
jgi:hypothetical protein